MKGNFKINLKYSCNNDAISFVFHFGIVRYRAENERHAIKMQTDDLKATHDHLATEKVRCTKEEYYRN